MKRSLIATLTWLVAAHVGAQATPCESLGACERAVERGAYASARAGLVPLSRGREGSGAVLALARVDLSTGQYRDGVRRLRPLLRGAGPARIAASTLLGELELASGHLDRAERALSAVANEPPAHRARVLLGRLLIRRGRDREAQPPLMALVQAYNDGSIGPRDAEGLSYVAMAAAMLGSARDANDAFLESTQVDARRVETQLEWAQLFLSHYDPGHAEESVRAALELNPVSARAHALLARIALVQSHDFSAAEASLERALATNPNLVEAHVLRAGISIRDMELGAATAHLDAALAIDSNHLEALSVRAALRFLSGDERAYREARQQVLDRNPHFARLYTIISEYAEWEHRYAAIVEMAREAIRIDPNDAGAYATLGINLLRLGEEEAGLRALRDAWSRDHYNLRVFNLLELWDHTITPHYQQVSDGPFVFRVHEDERAVLAPTLGAVLGGAFDDMRRRYGFTPQTPVHIELFSDREHFSVRTVGLPNAGVQGVCFGRVVTALSPRAGPFNWAEITWHELAHVFHLQLSSNRVPRWFTEGLAEYETMLARPEWRREEDHRLYLALAAGRLPPISQLNHAFTHARTADAITVAYYASSMLVKYIAETHGFEPIPRMLRAWGAGRSSAQVIEEVLGVSIDALDRAFRAHTLARLSRRRADFTVDFAAYQDLDGYRAAAERHPADAGAQADLAAALTAHGETDTEAMTAVRAALRHDRDNPIARFVAARLALARRDVVTARADLRRLFASGHDGYEPRLLEARAALAAQDQDNARRALEAAAAIDPDRHEAWQGLLELAEHAEDAGLQARATRELSRVDEHDRAVNFAMLEALVAANDWAGARDFGQRLVYLDPFRAEARRLFAEALLHAAGDAAPDGPAALVQADLALAAQPEHPAQAYLTRARALMLMRRRREARRATDAAIAADRSVEEEARAILR